MHPAAGGVKTSLSVLVFVVGWAMTPVFVRFMSDAYDPYTQAFLRYASAAAALTVYSLIWRRTALLSALRAWRTLAPMSLLVIVMQLAWTVAIYHTTATMAQMATTLQAPLVILLSYLVFHEERRVILNPAFLLGTLFCLLGVLGVFMREEGSAVRFRLDLALALLLFVCAAWAVYAVWGRHTAKNLHPVAMFSVVSAYVSLGFVATMFLFGNPATLLTAGLPMNGVAFLSGVICIAGAHCAFHYAQVRLGSAYCTAIQLTTPFITHLLALMLWPDEALIWIQWAGGIMLVCGSFLVIRTRRLLLSHPEPPTAR